MKKKIAILTAAVMIAGMLSACGKDTAYLSGIDASKYVTLGEYKGIEITKAEPVVPDGLVDYYIDSLMAQRAVTTEVTDRTTVEEGDTVNIDYTGYKDGVAFENGAAKGYNLTIGSGRFIPGFEDGLIGAEVGETVSIDLTFPEVYDKNPDLAGAAVTFEVTVNSISIVEIPELTDEIVQELSIEGCTTVDEFRDRLYESLYNDSMESYNQAIRTDMMNAVTANCIFKEPPKKMVERYYDLLVEGMTEQAVASGMNLDTYMYSYYGMDKDTYEEIFQEDSVKSAQQYIMYQAIADAEGLNMSDEEFVQAMEENATAYGYASVDEFKEQVGEDTFREYLMAEKVMDFLIENAVIKSE